MSRVLKDQVIAITGASSGIGAALALGLAPYHVKLVIGARRADRLNEVAAKVRAAGSECEVLTCDVGRRADVKAMVDTAVNKFGRLDVMVANAGYGLVARVHDMDEKAFDDIFQINVKGTWYAMQEAAEVMLKQKSGHIIAVSSAVGKRALPLYGVYSMTKAAQLSLAQAMRVELRGTGVYVSTVHPITTTTEFFDTASQRSGTPSSGNGPAQTAEKVARKIIALVRRPRPELWPHRPTQWGLAIGSIMPGVVDYAMKGMVKGR